MLKSASTLAIILGVSECPRAPKLQPLPHCANSAKDFKRYLLSSLDIPRKNIIDLFDFKSPASVQLGRIEDWLVSSTSASPDQAPTDLLLYYTGHGGFSRNDQSYFLAVQKTREGSEGATSIRYVDLASCIKRHVDTLRKYVILDCCFAAAAVLKIQTDVSQLVMQQVEYELPPSGTAYLCSSAAKLPSIAPPGERHTMFSGALLQCLREGVSKGPKVLTLEDVGKAARNIIRAKYPEESVRPELHVPEQTRGNPATVPLFPNLLWKPPEEQAGRPPNGSNLDPDKSARDKYQAGRISAIKSEVACLTIEASLTQKQIDRRVADFGFAVARSFEPSPNSAGIPLVVSVSFDGRGWPVLADGTRMGLTVGLKQADLQLFHEREGAVIRPNTIECLEVGEGNFRGSVEGLAPWWTIAVSEHGDLWLRGKRFRDDGQDCLCQGFHAGDKVRGRMTARVNDCFVRISGEPFDGRSKSKALFIEHLHKLAVLNGTEAILGEQILTVVDKA